MLEHPYGKWVKGQFFVMTLGYSRRMFAWGAYDEKLSKLLACHTEPFDHLGGIPHEIFMTTRDGGPIYGLREEPYL